MRTIHDVDITGKRVVLRSDLNVPIVDGIIQSEQRIISSLRTIRYILERGGSVVILSHLGRPVAGTFDERYSLQVVAESLSKHLGFDVPLVSHYLNGKLPEGRCILCENIRFEVGEVENSTELAEKLSHLGDIFVMDAFGTAHRAHASTVGIASFLPSYAGLLLEDEVRALDRAVQHIERPSIAIVGGSKVSSKLDILRHLIKTMDSIIVGGGIANTFLYACGYNIGCSLYEETLVDVAKEIMELGTVHLPRDVGVVKKIEAESAVVYKSVSSLDDDDIIVDIGMLTATYYDSLLEASRTIVWNGPVGIFEIPSMQYGTESLCRSISRSSGYSLAGGGDTISAIDLFGIANDISYISTGGGAFLEYIEGKVLPGIAILSA